MSSASETKEEPQPEKVTFDSLRKCILDETAPIAKRMRSVFFLRQIGGMKAIQTLADAMASKSTLLGHEVAYVLGQLHDSRAIPLLVAAVKNVDYHPIVRHEAAEGLAALGEFAKKDLDDHKVLPLLVELSEKDSRHEVRDTCLIAAKKLQWLEQNKANEEKSFGPAPKSKYRSVDPAPAARVLLSSSSAVTAQAAAAAAATTSELTIPQLKQQLNDTGLSLFDRYRAMFSLRNIGNPEAVEALASGFNDASAVFRHEIAYVFGQLQHPASIPSLLVKLADTKEHAMVRHEAAEALGAIAGQEAVTEPALRKFANDPDAIVAESVAVALDIADYWNSDQFDSAEASGEQKQDESKDNKN